MADLKALSGEMAKLKRQLETVLYISGYRYYDDSRKCKALFQAVFSA